MKRVHSNCIAFAAMTLMVSGIQAQERVIQTPPNRGGSTVSMGLPPTWRWSLGVTTGVNRFEDDEITFYVDGGVYKDLLAPVTAGLGALFEGYAGRRGTLESFSDGFDGGFRIQAYSPAVRLSTGYDYNFKDQRGDWIVSLIHPLQRGGIFVPGGMLRIDWLPTREHSLMFGLRFPVGQKWVGQTRPRNDYVRLPEYGEPDIPLEGTPELIEAMDSVKELSRWVRRLTVPFTDQWDGDKDRALEMFVEEMALIREHLESDAGPYYEGKRSAIGDTEAFHDELDRVFSIAASGREFALGESSELGRITAQEAREAIFDDVLLPYNQLLGQKRRTDSTTGFGLQAGGRFFEWLTRESRVPDDRLTDVVWVFGEYLEVVEEARQTSLEEWGEQRFVWLPFQFALRPEEHDEQDELNRLVERALELPFVPANDVWYVENEQWQAELSRMIRAAEDYHVIWIHDFRGFDANGDPDEMSFRQVTESYLPALINAVRRYNETGKIPQYIQIFDMFYFTANGGELWAELLQDPLRHELRLPPEFEQWEDSIASLQDQLRDAVEESRLLQAQAILYGEDWVHDLVKVHVNITQPPEAAFWTAEMFPAFMGLPDTPIRDHRKISFYDVSEDDPYQGEAIYTGMGVGEHYVGAGWEDRAILAKGPVLLQLRNSTRQVLLNQGFEADEIPWELQPRPLSATYGARIEEEVAARGLSRGLALEAHNQIGYRPKGVSVLKAALYSLMPPGAVIKAPDSIWGSNVWASMMLGHALRGGRSLVIAPAIANAPSAGSPQMSRAQEAMTRLVVADQMLGDRIEEEGGLIKVGLYSSEVEVGDVPGKIDALLETLESTEWLADLYNFHPEVIAGLAEERDELIAEGFERIYTVDQERVTAKLHMKAHLYYSREAWELFLSSPGLENVVRAHFEEAAAMNRALSIPEYRDYRLYSDRLTPMTQDMLSPLLTASPEELNRYVLFLTVGSANQNTRSLALDGEVAFLTAGGGALNGIMDFITIAGLSTWVEDLETLEELFPGYDGLARRISRFIRMVV